MTYISMKYETLAHSRLSLSLLLNLHFCSKFVCEKPYLVLRMDGIYPEVLTANKKVIIRFLARELGIVSTQSAQDIIFNQKPNIMILGFKRFP